MIDSIDRCHDKPIWALNQMTMVVLINGARGDRNKLKELGRRIMNLDIVHKHAKNKCKNLQFVDDVCIYLKYEIELREELDLPVSSLNMHFPSYASISSEDLSNVKQEISNLSQEDFESWLNEWSEWQRQLRLENAGSLKYESIRKRRITSTESVLVYDVLGEIAKEPICLNHSYWNFPDLMNHWIETGCDLNNTPISFDDLKLNLSK